jgi:hypothetical protein
MKLRKLFSKKRGKASTAMSSLPQIPAAEDESFLSSLDIPEVEAALCRNQTAEAASHACDYFRQKFSEEKLAVQYRIIGRGEREQEKILNTADELIQLRFTLARQDTVSFTNGVDWFFDPSGDPRCRWARELNRHRWAAVLALAFEYSGDTRYLNCCARLILDWIQNCPPLANKNESDVAWTLMGVGLRASIWCAVFPLFCQHGGMKDADLLAIIRSISHHAEFLFRHKTEGNHLIVESNSLATIASRFPEFTNAELQFNKAIARLNEELDKQVNSDGSHYEMSIPYQWFVADEYLETLSILSGSPWTADVSILNARLESLFEFLAYTIRPDYYWPLHGDGFYLQKFDRGEKMQEAVGRFDRPDLGYIASKGQAGIKPERTSILFPEGGLAILRSSWQPDAHYLAMDCGSFGGWHGHEDKLGIELCVYGEPFIRDPGSYTYNALDPYRHYFLSSLAHNTVTIDDLSQVRRWDKKYSKPILNHRQETLWHTEERFELLGAIYQEGYGDYKKAGDSKRRKIHPGTHTRLVIWVKPDYWILIDGINAGKGHKLSRRFQLEAGLTAEQQKNGWLAKSNISNNGLLLIDASNKPDTRLNSLTGSADPIGGWVSNGFRYDKTAAPQLLVESRSQGHDILVTVLYPLDKHHANKPPVISLDDSDTNSGLLLTIQAEGVHDKHLLHCANWIKHDFDIRHAPEIHCYRAKAGGESQLYFHHLPQQDSGQ